MKLNCLPAHLAIILTIAFPAAVAAPSSGNPLGNGDIIPKVERKEVPLEGKWKVVAGEIGGAEGVKPIKGKTWAFTDGVVKAEIAGDPNNPRKKFVMTFDYEVDPEKKPKQLVMTLIDEAGQTVVNRAIYEIVDQQLKLCWTFNPLPNVRHPFPQAFQSQKGNTNSMVLIFDRVGNKGAR